MTNTTKISCANLTSAARLAMQSLFSPPTRQQMRTAIAMHRICSTICTLAIAAPVFCAPITYDVDLQGTNSVVHGLSGSVVGTITTDGVQGAIGDADILDYSIVVTLGSNSSTLTPAQGEVHVSYPPLIADPTGLFESSSPAGYTVFEIVLLPTMSGDYFDLSSPYLEPAELAIRVDGVLDFFHLPAPPNSEAVLATAEPATNVGAVPEPDGIALVLIGGIAFGASMHRKRRIDPPKRTVLHSRGRPVKRLPRLAFLFGLGAAALSSSAGAAIISGYFNDAANAALISSNGFGDLEAAQFGSDDAVARNVAIYALDVTAPGTVEFASSGYAAGGAQPYLSIFAGSDTSATFVDSSYSDPNIDFDFSESLGAGQYLFAIGVYVNESFAENDPVTGTLADGFTALGDPDYLGSAFYQLNVDSGDATFTIAPASVIGGGVTQPSPTNVPEPPGIALAAIGMMSMIATRRRRIRNSRMSLPALSFNLSQEIA